VPPSRAADLNPKKIFHHEEHKAHEGKALEGVAIPTPGNEFPG
jgi:hypothetical protein